MNDINWNAVQGFIQIAKAGTLSDASKTLGISIPTLSRRLDLLEEQVGAPLFRRGPKGATLTQQGAILFKHADKGAKHLAQLSRLARIFKAGPDEVPIRVSATESMMSDVLAPRIPELLKQTPDIKLELDVSNKISNLNAGEADIAIRMVQPSSDTLIARKLPSIELGLFCSKHYLEGKTPNNINLKRERLIWLDKSFGEIAENQWLLESDLESSVLIRAVSVRTMLQAANSGAGIAILPKYSALMSDLIEIPCKGLPIRSPWLTFHRDSRDQAKMQIVRNWIVNSCEEVFD